MNVMDELYCTSASAAEMMTNTTSKMCIRDRRMSAPEDETIEYWLGEAVLLREFGHALGSRLQSETLRGGIAGQRLKGEEHEQAREDQRDCEDKGAGEHPQCAVPSRAVGVR